MIFVTIGNTNFRFMRLLKAVDELAASGFFSGETVLIQTGSNTEFTSEHCELRPLFGMDEFAATIKKANLVICHAGAGTISHVLNTGKTPVVFPRRLKYNEIIDDHQVELLEAFSQLGLIVPAYEPEDLPNAIRTALARPQLSMERLSPAMSRIGAAMEQLLSKDLSR